MSHGALRHPFSSNWRYGTFQICKGIWTLQYASACRGAVGIATRNINAPPYAEQRHEITYGFLIWCALLDVYQNMTNKIKDINKPIHRSRINRVLDSITAQCALAILDIHRENFLSILKFAGFYVPGFWTLRGIAVQTIRKCLGLSMMVWILTSTAARSVDAQDRVPCGSGTGIIESLQGIVEIRRQNDRLWCPAVLGEAVCPGDGIRVGEYGCAGLSLVETSEVLRLDQNTTIRLPADIGQERPLLDLIKGVVQFFSNHPRSFNVHTPFLNAGVEGTEFVVRVTSDETYLVVFSGRVRAENQFGALVVSGDRAVTARSGT